MAPQDLPRAILWDRHSCLSRLPKIHKRRQNPKRHVVLLQNPSEIMKLDWRKLQWVIIFGCCAAFFLVPQCNQRAQEIPKLPAPTGHINDFAGVLNEKTRRQLENMLATVKQKTGIEFDIATVESAGGQDVSDFSLQLAREWNIGTRTARRRVCCWYWPSMRKLRSRALVDLYKVIFRRACLAKWANACERRLKRDSLMKD